MTGTTNTATVQPRSAERKKFSKGERIFCEGEFAMCAYIVESGLVAIKKESYGETIPIATLGPGELFGEMALLLPSPLRSATAEAVENTVLLVVDSWVFTQKIENADPVLRRIIKVLMHRLRDAI